MHQSLLLARLFMRNSVLRARTVIVLAFLALDVLLAVVVANKASDLSAGYDSLARDMVLGIVIPLCAMLWGVAVIRDEVESGTLTYLLMRPISRTRLYVTRWLSASFAVALIGVGLTLAHTAILGVGGAKLLSMLAAVSLGSIAFTAVFAFVGAFFKRAFAVSVMFLLLFELPVSKVPFPAKHATISANLANIGGVELVPPSLLSVLNLDVAVATSLIIVGGFLAGSLALGIVVFERAEYTGEQEAS